MKYQITIETENSIYGKAADNYDDVLEFITSPGVTSYIVYKGEKQVTYQELASAWRHPARNGKYPPLIRP